jgi:hypothetical protein
MASRIDPAPFAFNLRLAHETSDLPLPLLKGPSGAESSPGSGADIGDRNYRTGGEPSSARGRRRWSRTAPPRCIMLYGAEPKPTYQKIRQGPMSLSRRACLRDKAGRPCLNSASRSARPTFGRRLCRRGRKALQIKPQPCPVGTGGCGHGVADHSCQALRRTRRQAIIW